MNGEAKPNYPSPTNSWELTLVIMFVPLPTAYLSSFPTPHPLFLPNHTLIVAKLPSHCDPPPNRTVAGIHSSIISLS